MPFNLHLLPHFRLSFLLPYIIEKAYLMPNHIKMKIFT